LTRLDLSKLSKNEVENIDFSTYLASGSESSEEESEAEPEEDDKPVKRDALRQMLGLDGSKPKKSKGKGVQGDMEITFMPALTEKSEGPVAPEDETAIQTYKRKEKERKQRKKAAKEAIQEDDSGDSDAPQKPMDPAKQAAELELLMSDDEDLSVPGRHFDMSAIVKHEKLSRSTKRKRNKKAKQLADQVGDDAFQLDAQDPRFAAVAQDPKFAIDPSNPRFKKTKNMDRLLDEARSQRDTAAKEVHSTQDGTEGGRSDLDQLIQSVKRKSTGESERRAGKKARKA
jgi:hypothetical protein